MGKSRWIWGLVRSCRWRADLTGRHTLIRTTTGLPHDKTAIPWVDHLYMLHDPLSHRRFRGSIGLSQDTLSITRGEIDPSDPIRVGWGMGGKIPSDVIWTQNAHPANFRVAGTLTSTVISSPKTHGTELTFSWQPPMITAKSRGTCTQPSPWLMQSGAPRFET